MAQTVVRGEDAAVDQGSLGWTGGWARMNKGVGTGRLRAHGRVLVQGRVTNCREQAPGRGQGPQREVDGGGSARHGDCQHAARACPGALGRGGRWSRQLGAPSPACLDAAVTGRRQAAADTAGPATS